MAGASPTFDLQSHSLHSDGALPPAEVVAAAAAAGVKLLALSDHDTTDGIAEALAAGPAHGVVVAPAVEISTRHGDHRDLHILGYRIDPDDAALSAWLREARANRGGRTWEMAAAIRELGYEIDEGPLKAREAEGRSLGRPHLAQAVVRHPANAERLRAEGVAETSAFLTAYLIEGKPAFRPRSVPPVAEAIAVIHAAGGVAVWAHPFWDIDDPADVLRLVDRFVADGLDGVECFYPDHDRDQTELLAERCQQLELLSTGSSDFHGFEHRHFSRFRAFNTYGRAPRLGPIAG